MTDEKKTRRFEELEPQKMVQYIFDYAETITDAEEAADRLAEKYGLDNLDVRAALSRTIGDKVLKRKGITK